MGPLVPDIIGNELNLIVGFLVGIAFGFVLEQAGFSSCRKLTGLFYGTDFTVLRVFFTAGATAMIGIVLLDALGLLDVSIVYVHPTFLHSALLGGAVMGVGFVVGGYCPGTSFCGAAIGKIDAMVFVLGGILGVFAFAEAYPLVQSLHVAGAFGDLLAFSALGLSRGAFVLLICALAVAAFVATTRIERRVSPAAPSREFTLGWHRLAGVSLLCIALLVAALPDRRVRLLTLARRPEVRQMYGARLVTADELAFRILDGDPRLLLIDVRPAADFARISLPGAVNVPVEAMFGKEWRDILGHPTKEKVFIGENGEDGVTAATLARMLSYDRAAALQGGLAAFRADILEAGGAPAPADSDVARFRARAGPALAALIKERAAPKQTAPRVKKIPGGCGY